MSIVKPRGPGVPWKPGQSGNPSGKPIGTRSAFSQAFLKDLTASWSEHGPTTLNYVARKDPVRYMGIAASLIPKDVSIAIEQRLPGALDPTDWDLIMQVLEAVKQAIPNASDRKPGEVLQFVVDAIRAHSSKTIEEEGTLIPPSSTV